MEGKRKKRVRFRGSKTHGWGSKKKHRGKGSQGGAGRAGSLGHRIRELTISNPRIGKRGFKSLAIRSITPKPRSISLRQVSLLAAGKDIDLTAHGYDKVLGSGTVTAPITIKAKIFSKKAMDKIAKAGAKAEKV